MKKLLIQIKLRIQSSVGKDFNSQPFLPAMLGGRNIVQYQNFSVKIPFQDIKNE
jgi:hypothetical protein